MFLKKITVLLLIVVLFIAAAKKRTDYGSVVVSRLVSVLDGDTIKVDIDYWPAIIGDRISVRIAGIDAPELRSKDPNEVKLAKEAKSFLQANLAGTKTIKLENIKRGKYFRILADVKADDVDCGELMIQEGFAVPYNP